MKSPTPHRNADLLSSNQIDFRAIYYLLRERSWVIVMCLLIAGFGTTAYLIRSPKIFQSKVVVVVEQEEQKILSNIESVHQENLHGLESLRTVEETLSNRALLARVIATNRLANDPRFVPQGLEVKPSEQQLVSQLARMIDVGLRKGTRVIDVRVEHTDPALTELIANSLVTEYVRQSSELSSSASKLANEVLLKEAEALKAKLEASENRLQAYKEETQSSSLEDQQNVVVQKLKELTAKVTEAKSERILHETAYKQVAQIGSDPEALMVIPTIANHPSIVEIRSQIGEQEALIANLKQRYREKHPKYLQAQSQLEEWKRNLNAEVLAVARSAGAAYQSAKAAEGALMAAFQEQERAALELQKVAIGYNVLHRDVEADRALYQSVLQRIKETSLTQNLNSERIRIVQPAVAPEFPVKPEKFKVAAAGGFAGLAAGILLAMFLNAIDRSLKTVDQAEDYLGLPVLSAIPKVAGVPRDQRKLILGGEAQSSEAESFRTLRTAVSMLGRKEDRRTFLFTSALPAEGKTFCSLNFALSLAQQGLKTLVIDCDLRRPMVEKTIVGKEAKRNAGLTDYLTGQQEFDAVVYRTEHENFHFLPAGNHTPNPAELLAQMGIDGVIEKALEQYDRVVVDSAPIHAVSDTLLVLERIQTVCLVAKVGKTPRNAVLRAVQILREANAPLSGVILNLLPRRRRAGYGYHYDSYYEYTYRDYCGDEGKPVAA